MGNDLRCPRIYYYQCYGEAEPIKMVLTYLEVDFEEYDITETMWKTRTNIPEEIKNCYSNLNL